MNQGSAGFFVAGGALRFDAPSYIERPADRQLREYAAAGELCYVLTTRQMGKSSLMVRTAASLQEQNIRTAIIDLTSIGRAPIDEWFLSLLDDLQSQLAIEIDAEGWWEAHRSLSQVKRFTKFVQEVVPQEVDGQVAIFIDEIDSMLNFDFADDFFAAIRAIYNRGASLPAEQRVSFVLLGVAAPNDLIKDQTRTPFNIGRQVRLDELTLEEAQDLLRGIPGENRAILERIFFWTNGHPYLTQKIGLAITLKEPQEWTDPTIDDLVQRLFLTDEAFNQESNLQFVRARIISSPNKKELLWLYRKVYDGDQIRNNEQSIFQKELKLYGLLRADDQNYLVIRNRIYREVFSLEWIKEHTPINRWRRFAAVALLLVVLAVAAGFYFWWSSPQPAQLSPQLADDVLAESYISGFEETANSTIRLNTLANLFALGGYDQEALELFNTLPAEEQIALFENLTPDLELQVRQVVKNVYTMLYSDALYPASIVLPTLEPCDSCMQIGPGYRLEMTVEWAEMERVEKTHVLEVMMVALEQSTDAESRALHDEIGIWLEARSYTVQEDYLSARTAYDLAITLNDQNPATRFERALTASKLGDPESAISDLMYVWQQGSPWERSVIDTVDNDEQIQAAVWEMEVQPPFINHVPTPMAASSPILTATPNPAASSISIPDRSLIDDGGACSPNDADHIVAGDNTRLWSQPNVLVSSETESIEAGTALDIIGGPAWGRIRTDIDISDWWWEVTTKSGAYGWIWQARIVDCVSDTILLTPVYNRELIVLGYSVEEQPIEAVRFGNGENVVVLIGGLQGGYSPGAVDLAYRAVEYFGMNLEAIPDSVTLYIVVNANPDAPHDPGNPAGRFNANGVDLNRNWDCKWEKDPRIANVIIEEGGGTNAFSEPETEVLRDFFLGLRPQAVVFWIARAANGVVISGGCRNDPLISDLLGEVYGGASRYRFIAEEDSTFVPGDATNWLTEQGFAAVAVVLPEYERTDWNNNLEGILAVLESYK